MSTAPARCDLCGAFWQPEAAPDALTCRNTLRVCVDASACHGRRELAASLARLINQPASRRRDRKDVTVDDPMIVTTVRTYRDAAGEFRWHAIAGNGDRVAVAGEGYHNFRDALRPPASWWPTAIVKDDTGHVGEGLTLEAAFASL